MNIDKIGLKKLNPINEKYKQLFLQDIKNKKILLEDVTTCICCGSSEFDKVLDVDRFDLSFGSYLCRQCGLVTTSPRVKQDSLPYYYDKYYHPLTYGKESLVNQVALFKKGQGQKIFNKIKPYIAMTNKLTVLEVGAGTGNVLDEFREEALSQNIDVELLGTEYSSECILECKKRNIHILEGNSSSALMLNQKFDLIILSHVFEHFINLRKEIEILRKLLNKDGILYIEVPGIKKNHNKDYYDFSFLGYSTHAHMYNFTLTTLTNTIGQYGFTLRYGNEEVEAIFQETEHHNDKLINDYLKIKYYLDFLTDNQVYAISQKAVIKKLSNMLENRDQGIAELKVQLEKHRTMLENRDQGIAELKVQLERHRTMLENRDQGIAELKVELEKQKMMLVNRDRGIEKLKAQVEKQKMMLVNRDKGIEKLKAQVEKKIIINKKQFSILNNKKSLLLTLFKGYQK